MKATELMIGDWVYCTFWIQKRIERVWELKRAADDELRVVVMDEVHLVFQEKYFEPIPLTAKILHANFPNAHHNVFWYFNYRVSNETDFLYEIHIVKNIDEELTLNLRYVHELQHALRLCEIEKDIEL